VLGPGGREWTARSLITVGALALVASAATAKQLADGFAIGERNSITQRWYVPSVWAELLVLAAFVASVAFLGTLGRPAHARTQLSLVGFLPGLFVAALGCLFGIDVGVEILTLYAVILWSGSGRSAVARPLVIAFALRVGLALVFTEFSIVKFGQLQIWDDEVAYHNAAKDLAPLLAAGSGDLEFEWRHLASHYLDLLGLVYWVFGWSGHPFITIRLINAGLGTVAVAMTASIGRSVWKGSAGAVAAWLVALWPMVIVWSASGLREPLAVVCALTVLWVISRLPVLNSGATRLLAVVTIVQAITMLASLRPEWVLALGASGVAGLVAITLRRRTRARVAAVLIGASAAAAGLVVFGSSVFGAYASPRAIEYRLAVAELTPLIERDRALLPPRPAASFMALGVVVRVHDSDGKLVTGITAGYTYAPPGYQVLLDDQRRLDLPSDQVEQLSDTNISVFDVLARVLEGTGLVLLPVSAEAAQDVRRLALAPDTLAWDCLLLLSGITAWRERRHLGPLGLAVVLFPLVTIVVLAITSTNLGTVVRHRSNLVPWLAVLAEPLLARWFVTRRLPARVAAGTWDP
jgi:hypothetical protein